MNESRRVRATPGEAKAAGAARSRTGRLMALLSVLTAVGRRPRDGVAATLPSRKRYPTDRWYTVPGGHDLVNFLR